MKYDDIGRFSVDEKDRLLWDGRPVGTKAKLGFWVKAGLVLAALGGLGGFASALFQALRFFGLGAG